jgi:hypothetical protein
MHRYVQQRFQQMMRAAKIDVWTLASQSAEHFYESVIATLQLCHSLLLNQSDSKFQNCRK